MQYDEFKGHFSILTDSRQSKKLTYNFFEILFQVITAMLCGYKTWEEMEIFGEENLSWFRKFSEFENGVPSHDTISRVIGMIEPEEFALCFTRWCNDIRRDKQLETTHVAIDGKALRGTYDYSKNKCLVHMVNAYSVDTGLVLGQIKTEAKSNEITIIPELLKLIRVKNQVISLDAMGCQRVIADDIKSREGDYLLAVKGKPKKLHDMFLERLPFRVLNGLKCDKHSTEEDNSRGRKMIRDYYVIQINKNMIIFQ